MKKFTGIFFLMLILAACDRSTTSVASKDYYYTCSMHPQVVETHPGLCPICHMDLIKVKRTQSAPDEVTLNEEQIRLGNIIVDTISTSETGNKNILTAIINADESRTEGISARIPGRVEKLFYKTSGEFIVKGQPVFSIYSEELNNAKQELIVLMQKKKVLDNSILNFDNLIEASKEKLHLLGMTNAQIESLVKNGKSSNLTTFYSPVSGYVTELPVSEGDYVSEGSMVIKVADLSRLWVEAQVYASQLPVLAENALVDIEFPDLPGKKVQGKVSFVSPELIPDSRITLMRIEISNMDGKLRPGMAAYVIAKSGLENKLTLPTDAIIRDGEKNIVWLRTGPETFKWKKVETGSSNNHQTAIVSGLTEGDNVVVSGAYLLNSEYLLKKGVGRE